MSPSQEMWNWQDILAYVASFAVIVGLHIAAVCTSIPIALIS
jgi:hypothetical protein